MEAEGKKEGGVRVWRKIQKRPAQIWRHERGQGFLNLDPCLARVQREQKAAAEAARFGAHFTWIVRYSVLHQR